MDPVGEVWSSGIWTVKAGRASEFIEAWQEFAEWSNVAHGPTFAWLLRHRDRPGEFESIGPWPDDATMAAWRADPEFGRRIGRLRDLVDAFEARTFDPVAAVRGRVPDC